MKWRLVLAPVFLLILVFGTVVVYYKFEPEMLTRLSFYVDLANPSMRIVKLNEGWRKEEVVEMLFKRLNWSEEDKEIFLNLSLASKNSEGKYFPKTYLIHKDEDPAKVRNIMLGEFSKNFKKIKSKNSFDEDTVVKIASIIQREAADRHDMGLISGILWNRMRNKMKLQVDATLQYVKGNEENDWWPSVTGKDRKLKSPYNTYLNNGLPPSAISNPGLVALAAAYNPEKTDCLFFIHDKNRNIHCTKTYEEHEKNIEKYLK